MRTVMISSCAKAQAKETAHFLNFSYFASVKWQLNGADLLFILWPLIFSNLNIRIMHECKWKCVKNNVTGESFIVFSGNLVLLWRMF
jgi:hypothetical protein